MADRNTKFEDLTFKEKIEQIWEYYKLPIFAIVGAVALVIYIIVKLLNPDPDSILDVTLINANGMGVAEEDVFDRYLAEHEYNTEEETITVVTGLYLNQEDRGQSTYASIQALTARLSVGEIDLLIGQEYTMDLMGASGGLKSMEELLPEGLVEKYKDRLYAVEDPDLGEKVLCGIWLGEDNPLVADGYYTGKVLAGIPSTASHEELAVQLLLVLLGEADTATGNQSSSGGE